MKERSSGIASSAYYLPLIRTYAEALLRFQKTKPIRGRAEDKPKWGSGLNPTTPLGRREDVDTYSIRKAEDGSIQLINYRHPLITFTPDNLIHITPKYMGIMESGMIERILGIEAWVDRKKIGIKLDDDGDRHVIEAGKTLVLDCSGCEDVDGEIVPTLKLHAKETIYSYYVNRKGANNVRARYSDFSKYLHGFMQLRKEVIDNNSNQSHYYNRSHYQTGDEVLRIQMSEIADCIGYEYSETPVWNVGVRTGTEKVWKPNVSGFRFIDDKPQGISCLNTYVLGSGNDAKTHWERYLDHATAFLELASNGQADETRTDNFYRATLTLLGLTLGYIYRTPRVGEDATMTIGVNTVMNAWNNIVMKFHSDEVFDKRALKPNQLPNDRYSRFITIMPTQEEIDRVRSRRPTMADVNFNI